MRALSESKILIVDDDPLIVRYLTEVLKALGQIISATDGETALALARSAVPDLIVLDVMMPGLDGYEVCRRLKNDEQTQSIPVVFATASDREDDEVRGLELGAVDFITKPINPRITRTRVRNHLEAKRRRDLLEELAFIDGLTAIANRRRFDQVLADEWNRCARSGATLSLVLLDIDYFKAYNDNYGHGGGDECLTRVAEALDRVERRPADIVARFGGEEFACILPETGGDGCLSVAESLLEAVRALNIPHEYSLASSIVTLSAGAASIVPTDEKLPQTLIDAADRLLYQAKEAGRDRVIFGDV